MIRLSTNPFKFTSIYTFKSAVHLFFAMFIANLKYTSLASAACCFGFFIEDCDMKFFKKNVGPYPFGIWIALVALILIFLAWLMQGYSLLNWESAVAMGLQNGSFEGDELSRVLATKERGEAIADLLWAFPITIVAFVGLWRKVFVGFVGAMMAFAICVYFPLFYVFQLWNINVDTAIAAVVLWAIPSLLGIVGLWTNRKLFMH
jgi:hypothetical protein